MVIFLPTFGFTTAQASIEFLWNTNKNDTYRWECIFLPDSGAFFVNYVTTAALVGAGLELIRFPDLFWYFIQICWSRSRAENPAIQRNIRYEFRFGEYVLFDIIRKYVPTKTQKSVKGVPILFTVDLI